MVEISGRITKIIKNADIISYNVPDLLITDDKDIIVIKTGMPKSRFGKILWFIGLHSKFFETILTDGAMLSVGDYVTFEVQYIWVQSNCFTTDLGGSKWD